MALEQWLTSGRLCKSAEGSVFPVQVELREDGLDDEVHGLHADEADYGPGAADFSEAAFDDVGGS